MESPKTGIVLLALVAFTTALGGFLGWTMRPQAAPVDLARSVTESSIGVPGTIVETPAPAEPSTEKPPSPGQ